MTNLIINIKSYSRILGFYFINNWIKVNQFIQFPSSLWQYKIQGKLFFKFLKIIIISSNLLCQLNSIKNLFFQFIHR